MGGNEQGGAISCALDGGKDVADFVHIGLVAFGFDQFLKMECAFSFAVEAGGDLNQLQLLLEGMLLILLNIGKCLMDLLRVIEFLDSICHADPPCFVIGNDHCTGDSSILLTKANEKYKLCLDIDIIFDMKFAEKRRHDIEIDK